jgi:putative addiction module CopG family antidote
VWHNCSKSAEQRRKNPATVYKMKGYTFHPKAEQGWNNSGTRWNDLPFPGNPKPFGQNGNRTNEIICRLNLAGINSMRKTMNISLSDELHEFVTERVAVGSYGSASEYVRTLVRRDRAEHLQGRNAVRPATDVRRANYYLNDAGKDPEMPSPWR